MNEEEDESNVEEGLLPLPLKETSKELRARLKREKERDAKRKALVKERLAGGAKAKFTSSHFNAASNVQRN